MLALSYFAQRTHVDLSGPACSESLPSDSRFLDLYFANHYFVLEFGFWTEFIFRVWGFGGLALGFRIEGAGSKV